MNLKTLTQNTVAKLEKAGIDSREAALESEILLDFIFGTTKKDLILNPDKILPEEKLKKFDSLIKRRIKEKIPVQYLTNKAYFMGEEFYVDENVLIPRPETELLVANVLGLIDTPELKVLDIGTGSGCIACMLSKFFNKSTIYACDISEKALKVAKLNAKKLGLENKITFIKSDIFEKIEKNIKFDAIVSNPPYIPLNEKACLQPEVAIHEPHQALFVPDELGVSFYEKLALEAKNRLAKNGFVAVEIGINQSACVSEIFKANGFGKIRIIQDYAGIDRIVIAKF